MMTSTTMLALGTSAGTLVASILSVLIVGALGMYTLLHHKQVLAWMNKIQKKGEKVQSSASPPSVSTTCTRSSADSPRGHAAPPTSRS
ncbi:hypothetical protein NFX46_19130 [Streptomyces phaeoluteigriseus]|uniref:Uncharacterized protein n=1 Tax=Streptomyces phaeoluteigriseus TaxID=114686 RepID=A0ABY4ZA37_9ACTN|nr:hypothetical protein [Streptomyces phaeoluteigriseus]USQ85684.1 hypothetical protein NFX46_19130 [Streptomyces phaeoluteigriseus]